MPTNLLLLPLVGGYCLTHFCYYFRFRSQRLDGYRLLLESALAGILLAILSPVSHFVSHEDPLGPGLESQVDLILPLCVLWDCNWFAGLGGYGTLVNQFPLE